MGETEVGEVHFVAHGESVDARMAEGQGQARVEHDPTSDVRLGRAPPDFRHHGRGVAGIINERPRWVLTKGLNERDGIGSVEWVFDDSRVAQQDLQFDQDQFANGHLARRGGE